MAIKYKERKLTLADAVSEACSVAQDLGNELREAFDNTPESLQQSAVGQAREEAADTLEGFDEVEVPESLSKVEMVHTERELTFKQQNKQSRSNRRDGACALLDGVISACDDIMGDDTKKDLHEDAEALHEELSTFKDNFEAVEFPGRNG